MAGNVFLPLPSAATMFDGGKASKGHSGIINSLPVSPSGALCVPRLPLSVSDLRILSRAKIAEVRASSTSGQDIRQWKYLKRRRVRWTWQRHIYRVRGTLCSQYVLALIYRHGVYLQRNNCALFIYVIKVILAWKVVML